MGFSYFSVFKCEFVEMSNVDKHALVQHQSEGISEMEIFDWFHIIPLI